MDHMQALRKASGKRICARQLKHTKYSAVAFLTASGQRSDQQQSQIEHMSICFCLEWFFRRQMSKCTCTGMQHLADKLMPWMPLDGWMPYFESLQHAEILPSLSRFEFYARRHC